MDTKEYFDIIVVGAGPAGLTAGIIAAQNRLNVLVLEKEKTPGFHPRGESFRPNSFLESLLGIEFFETKCFKNTGNSIYHSPGDRKQFKRFGKKPLYFFEWHDLIETLLSKAKKLDLDIRTNTCVDDLIVNDSGICIGVEYSDQSGQNKKAYSKVVFGCDGHKSVVGEKAHIPYEQLNCPMIKCRATLDDFDIKKIPDLQFYLIGNGDLSLAPEFPQSVAYMFPIGGKKVELGLMLRMMHVHKMTDTVKIPDSEQLLQVWDFLKKHYPGFKTYFEQAHIEIETPTELPNTKMVDSFIPVPGAVLIGDAAGFVDPFGSSGLYTGMAMASRWVFLVKELLQKQKKDLTTKKAAEILWTFENIEALTKRFKSSSIYKSVKASYRIIGVFEWFVFKRLRTSKRINKRWSIISWMMQKT